MTSDNGDKWLRRAVWMIPIVSFIGMGFMAFGADRSQLQGNTDKIALHETRIDDMESHLIEQKVDLKYIRHTLEGIARDVKEHREKGD